MQNAYVVIVNNKYMMRVQAESAYDAEHAVLDRFADEINKYHVITCVKAFEQYKIKTSWLFRDYFLRCDFINMRLLEELVKDYVSTMQDLEDVQSLLLEAEAMVEIKEAELKQSKKVRDKMLQDVNLSAEQRKRQAEDLGMQL